MKDDRGRIILIILSSGGQLGEQVSSWFPAWIYEGSAFEEDNDLEELKRYRA